MDPYKSKMVKLANKLRKDEIEQIKYLFSDIGEAILEKVTTGLDLIRILEIHGYVGADNLDTFKGILLNLDRPDLLEILTGEPQPSFLTTVTLHTAKRPNELTPSIIDKISYNIGSDWRRFGRHLNLEEAELELIDSDNRKTIDKATEVLTSWGQKKENRNWELLKVCLESFQRIDIIVMVEKEFKSDKAAQYDLIKIEKEPEVNIAVEAVDDPARPGYSSSNKIEVDRNHSSSNKMEVACNNKCS